MKKLILIFTVILLSINSYAQFVQYATVTDDQSLFDSLLVEGIREFHLPAKQQNFVKAVKSLEEAVQVKPNNASAHYYLGYAYSRLNTKNGRQLPSNTKSLCIKSSNEMLRVIELDSNFVPKLALSPYSKITAEWGSLALKYYIYNKTDSMKWAFQEGKRMGGFSDFMLEYQHLLLNQCADSAILFSAGDDNFWNLLYVQLMDEYRTDIAVIDLGLLNTHWYQQMLVSKHVINFDIAPEVEEEYYLVSYKDTLIDIPIYGSDKNYLWHLEARGSNPFYLQYNDIAMRNILSSNHFRRSLFFTSGIPKKQLYHMDDHLENQIIVNGFKPFGKSELDEKEFNKLAESTLKLASLCNMNSVDERRILDNIRIAITSRIYYDWASENRKENAQYLMNLMNQLCPNSDYPYIDQETNRQMRQFRRVIMAE